MSAPTVASATGGDIEGGVEVPVLVSNLPPEPEIDKGFLKPIPETTIVERVAGGVACAGVITALIAMIIEQSAVVIVAGILSIVVGPYAYYQQTRLTDIRTLQETQKVVQQEVDKLQDENKRLASNITDLTTSVEHLEDVQHALDVITNSQGQSIDEFAKQVNENKSILTQMKTNLKASVLQNLLSVILRGDSDQDMTISEAEVDDVVKKLNDLSGLKLRETKFRQAITGKSIQAVMDVVKNLLREDTVPDDDVIFEIRPQ